MMWTDGFSESVPMRVDIKKASEIFSVLSLATYSQGAAVMRMLEGNFNVLYFIFLFYLLVLILNILLNKTHKTNKACLATINLESFCKAIWENTVSEQ